jgi:hypothetical protein
MLKTSEKEEFIASQTTEIAGLHKFDVMDIHHISKLPPRARLLSSIWSYRRKRLPNGVLLKYKSQLCVNGKEQSFGRDYWETYAPVGNHSTDASYGYSFELENETSGLYSGISTGNFG